MTARILVTGAQGLLGGVLARRLARLGHEIVATGRRPSTQESAEFQYLPCELSDPDAVHSLFADKPYDAVVHSAARVPGERHAIASFVRDNILAAAVLADAAYVARVRRFIFCSTISVYSGDGPFVEESPTAIDDAYGWSKRRAEEICLRNNEDENRGIVLRLGGLHGHPRRDGVIHRFFDRARRGEPIPVAEPETRTTITFFDDVVALIERIVLETAAPTSAIYNVAAVGEVAYRELAETILKQVEGSSRIISPPSSRKRNRVLDTGRLRRELGFQPLPLSEHLARYAQACLPRPLRAC